MIHLPHIFSSGALFQQSSVLTLRGTSDKAEVTVQLLLDGTVLAEKTVPVTDGHFSAAINTPAASLSEHTIRLYDGDEVLLEHILFGELWLASGQSNMEYRNLSMPGCDSFLTELDSLPIRVYAEGRPAEGGAAKFPRTPIEDMDGHWCTSADHETIRQISAVGTAFLKELTHYFRDRIPVGILNASWGGTPINGWLPESAIYADEELAAKWKALSLAPMEDNWNQRGDRNFQQPFCLYNTQIAPLRGVRVRGVIWYQGENDAAVEFTHKIYRLYLRCYHKAYAEEFAADPLNFMMISSLLYPWTYSASGETHLGRLNQAFIDTAVQEPHKFAFAPISDLPPIWDCHAGNSPIHPANKYDVGYRLALLAETNSYDRGSQRTPATLLSCTREGDRLLLRFKHASSGLRIEGKNIRGLYIAGEDGVYMAAKCAILAPDTLSVWHPYLKNPVHAAYGYASFEECINLFAGEFPVAPFATDTEHEIHIECKPWLDPTRTSVWVLNSTAEVNDVFYHPVWQPLPGAEICTDTAFTRGAMSIRICSAQPEFGAAVKSYPYNRLDLQNYAALQLDLFSAHPVAGQLEVCCENAETHALPIEETEIGDFGWRTARVDLSALPGGNITEIRFRFTAEKKAYFVNMENLILIPKE